MNKNSGFLNRANRVVLRINNVTVSISAISILILNFVVLYDVIMRYIFNRPTLWATEISSYLLLIITFISAAFTEQENAHVNCTLLLTRLEPKVRRIFFLVASPFGLMYLLLLAWQVLRLFLKADKENWLSGLDIPLKYPYLLIPIGVFLLILTYVFKVIGMLIKPSEDFRS